MDCSENGEITFNTLRTGDVFSKFEVYWMKIETVLIVHDMIPEKEINCITLQDGQVWCFEPHTKVRKVSQVTLRNDI